METQTTRKLPYILYYNRFSICSLMVRYTLAIRGVAKDPADEMDVKEREIDIFHEGQLEESFLCDVNPKGQVPALSCPETASLSDSLKITMFIAERYPQLLPTTHKTQLCDLLQELHAINYFSISFPDKPHIAEGIKTAVLRRLKQPGLSQRYLKALEYKLEVTETEKIAGIRKDKVDSEIERSRSLLSILESALCAQGPGPWLFGFDRPIALDAHVIVFINRLRDVGRAKLISSTLAKYADAAMETSGWRKLMD